MTEHSKPKTREERAKLEIGHTEISRPVKWTLFLVGLFTLFAIPTVQTYREIRQYAAGTREHPWPQCCDILDALPRATVACSASGLVEMSTDVSVKVSLMVSLLAPPLRRARSCWCGGSSAATG